MAKDYSAPTEAIAAPAAATSAVPTIPMKADHPFFLMVSPTSWECVETDQGNQWLPRLKHFHECPGCNGVKGGPGLGTDSSHARTQARGMGRIVFDDLRVRPLPDEILALDDPPMPREAGLGYMVRYRVARGYKHCARWDVPVKYGDQVELETNYLQKWAFQRWIVDTGQVPKPDPAVLSNARRIKRKRIKRNQKRAHLPGVTEVINQAQADLVAMSEAERKQGYGKPLSMASKKADLIEHCIFLELDFKPSFSKAKLLELIEGAPK